MSDVTTILRAAAEGDPAAAEQLVPLVYEELRRLAAAMLAREPPGQTLQATALVHEAYLRLVRPGVESQESGISTQPDREHPTGDCCPRTGVVFNSRGHFFAAAAEAMRRILIEAARRRKQPKHGGGLQRLELNEAELAVSFPLDELLAIDEALSSLAESDAQTAELVKLHCFAGLSIEEAAQVLQIPARTAYRDWTYARAWLFRRIRPERQADQP